MKDPDETRRVRRVKTNMQGRLVTQAGTVDVQVADISVNGCRLVARSLPVLASPVTLVLPEADLEVGADVVWQRGHSAGLRFLSRRSAPDQAAAGEALSEAPPDDPGRERTEV